MEAQLSRNKVSSVKKITVVALVSTWYLITDSCNLFKFSAMNKKITFLVILLTIVVSFTFLYIFEKIHKLELAVGNITQPSIITKSEETKNSPNLVQSDSCGEVCKEEIAWAVSQAVKYYTCY